MATPKEKERIKRNAEVTAAGIKPRGTSIKTEQKLTIVNSTPLGQFKKYLIYASLLLLASGNFIGLYAVHEVGDLYTINSAWTAGAVLGMGLLTNLFAKME